MSSRVSAACSPSANPPRSVNFILICHCGRSTADPDGTGLGQLGGAGGGVLASRVLLAPPPPHRTTAQHLEHIVHSGFTQAHLSADHPHGFCFGHKLANAVPTSITLPVTAACSSLNAFAFATLCVSHCYCVSTVASSSLWVCHSHTDNHLSHNHTCTAQPHSTAFDRNRTFPIRMSPK